MLSLIFFLRKSIRLVVTKQDYSLKDAFSFYGGMSKGKINIIVSTGFY